MCAFFKTFFPQQQQKKKLMSLHVTKENGLDVQLFNAIMVGYCGPLRAILEESEEWPDPNDKISKVGPLTLFTFRQTNTTAVCFAVRVRALSLFKIFVEMLPAPALQGQIV